MLLHTYLYVLRGYKAVQNMYVDKYLCSNFHIVSTSLLREILLHEIFFQIKQLETNAAAQYSAVKPEEAKGIKSSTNRDGIFS